MSKREEQKITALSPRNQIDSIVNLSTLKMSKNPADAQNLLQYIILLAHKFLVLQPKHTISLLAQKCKFWKQIIIKGIKSSFEKIIELFKYIIEHTQQLIKLIRHSNINKNVQFISQIINPCYTSKDERIVQYGTSIIIKLAEELKKDNVNVYVNFAVDLEQLCLCFNMESNSTIIRIITGNYKDFFTVQLPKYFKEQEYLKFVLNFINNMQQQSSQAKSQFIQSQIYNSLISYCRNILERQFIQIQTCKLSLELIYQLWIKLGQVVTENPSLSNQIIQLMQKVTRKESYILMQQAFIKLFNLLNFLANLKNPLAGLVYKKLVFMLLENNTNLQIRQIIIHNLVLAFVQFSTIPVDICVTPFLKQLQLKSVSQSSSSYVMNIFDVEFLRKIINHPKLSAQSALLISTQICELYLKNLVFSRSLLICISQLINRFKTQDAIIQNCISNAIEFLNDYKQLCIPKKNVKSAKFNKQRKALIVEIIKRYGELRNQDMTEKLKDKVKQIYKQMISEYNIKTDIGLNIMLEVLGGQFTFLTQSVIESSNNTIHPQILNKNLQNNPHIATELLKKYGVGLKRKKSTIARIQTLSPPDEKTILDIEKFKVKYRKKYNNNKDENLLYRKFLNMYLKGISQWAFPNSINYRIKTYSYHLLPLNNPVFPTNMIILNQMNNNKEIIQPSNQFQKDTKNSQNRFLQNMLMLLKLSKKQQNKQGMNSMNLNILASEIVQGCSNKKIQIDYQIKQFLIKLSLTQMLTTKVRKIYCMGLIKIIFKSFQLSLFNSQKYMIQNPNLIISHWDLNYRRQFTQCQKVKCKNQKTTNKIKKLSYQPKDSKLIHKYKFLKI